MRYKYTEQMDERGYYYIYTIDFNDKRTNWYRCKKIDGVKKITRLLNDREELNTKMVVLGDHYGLFRLNPQEVLPCSTDLTLAASKS